MLCINLKSRSAARVKLNLFLILPLAAIDSSLLGDFETTDNYHSLHHSHRLHPNPLLEINQYFESDYKQSLKNFDSVWLIHL